MAEAGPQPFRQDVQHARQNRDVVQGAGCADRGGGLLTADRSGSRFALKVGLKSV